MKPKSTRLPSLFLLFSCVAYALWCVLSLRPPHPVPSSADATVFSAERAMEHLEVIAQAPHSVGTMAHRKVREYIIEQCQKMGLPTTTLESTGVQVSHRYVNAGYSRNVMAVLKGTAASGKAILVMSHYDSQPNTLGAADDGAGVVAMLESIRALRAGTALKNDVIFLFTDLEEVGLLGAESFVAHYPKLDSIGLILNFESRGNAGVSFTFEVSENNQWVIQEFAKSAKYPFANSLAYEIYKRMPNDSDFTMFKDLGIPGLNSAFIDGYVNYHSMTDSPENIDRGSLQHHGTHLLGMLQHFGQEALDEKHPQKDSIFFNPVGSWLLTYPYAWDLPLVLLTLVLWIAVFSVGIRKKRIRLKPVSIGLGLFLLSILLSMLLIWCFQAIVLKAYGHYGNFYNNNFYNFKYYLLGVLGCCLLGFGLTFQRAIHRLETDSLTLGAFILLLLFMLGMKYFLATGAYILYLPLIGVALVYLAYFLRDYRVQAAPWPYALGQVLALLPALGLWATFVVTLFVVFSFALPYASAFFIVLFFPFLIPLFYMLRSLYAPALHIAAALLLVLGPGLGHWHSSYSTTQPLQTQLMYAVDDDAQKALWVAFDAYLDPWTSAHATSKEKEEFTLFYPESKSKAWQGTAPSAPYTLGEIHVLQDSIGPQGRWVDMVVTPGRKTENIDLSFSTGILLRSINERQLPPKEDKTVRYLRFFGAPPQGIRLKALLNKDEPLSMTVVERYVGIPTALFTEPMPDYLIHGTGYKSNSVQIKRNVDLLK